jgi:hypothetical protein
MAGYALKRMSPALRKSRNPEPDERLRGRTQYFTNIRLVIILAQGLVCFVSVNRHSEDRKEVSRMRFDYGSGGYVYETRIHGFVRPDGTCVRICNEAEAINLMRC